MPASRTRKGAGAATHKKAPQQSRGRSRESVQESSDQGRDGTPKRQKTTSAKQTLDAKTSREELARTSERFAIMVDQYHREMDNSSSDLLKTLSSFSTEAGEMAALQRVPGQPHHPRPDIYKTSMQCLEYSHALLKAYEGHNAHVLSESAKVNPRQWEEHITFVSKSLESGVSYGLDLVDALLKPSREPKLPMLDEGQAQETEKMGVELFEKPADSKDTWGRAARLMLDGWSEFLSTPAQF